MRADSKIIKTVVMIKC